MKLAAAFIIGTTLIGIGIGLQMREFWPPVVGLGVGICLTSCVLAIMKADV